MSEQPLHIEDLPGSREGIRILRLAGPLTLSNLFGFQSQLRADQSRALILDFAAVPLADSAGIGALVGAYVSRQKDGRTLGLVGVNQRIHQALEVTRVESFFRFYVTIAEGSKRHKRKAAVAGRSLFPNFGRGLDAFNVFRLPALGALHYV